MLRHRLREGCLQGDAIQNKIIFNPDESSSSQSLWESLIRGQFLWEFIYLSSILREFHQFELKMQAVPRFELFHVQQSRAQGRSYLLMVASSRTCHWRSAGIKSLLAETLEIRGAPSSVPVHCRRRSSVIARGDTRRRSLMQARPLHLSELRHRHACSRGRTTPSHSTTSHRRCLCCGTPMWL
jgi:hypothetical protein